MGGKNSPVSLLIEERASPETLSQKNSGWPTSSGRHITRMVKMKKKQAPAITWITMFALLLSMCASFIFSQRAAAQQKAERQPVSERDARVPTDTEYPALTKYATDLTALALRGKLETVKGHEADVARVI